MDNQKQLETDIKDLLNQLAVLLKDVPEPELSEYDDDDYGYSRIVSFQDETPKLASVKVVVEALLKDMDNSNKWSSASAKMARSYYTSFCNA